MIQSVISYSVRNKILILLCAAILLAWGAWSVRSGKIDAIPDLSENQVIVFTEWMGRSPQIMEDQVTYPLVTNLQGLPKVKYVRGSSMFGMSFIYAIFEDEVDIFAPVTCIYHNFERFWRWCGQKDDITPFRRGLGASGNKH